MAALLVATSGCGDDGAFAGQRVWESEHFRYHSYAEDDSVCREVMQQLERDEQRHRLAAGGAATLRLEQVEPSELPSAVSIEWK